MYIKQNPRNESVSGQEVVHKEATALASQTGIHEKRRKQQTPQVTRLYTKLVTVFCSGEVKGDNLR